MSAADEVLYEKVGRVGTLTINRPHRRNALNVEVAMQVFHKLTAASLDPDLAVLVFRGAGADFCAGADILPAGQAGAPEGPPPAPETRYYYVSNLLHTMRPVTIAAIKGGCAGAGLGWAAACDFRVADTTARFNSAFLDVGVAGDMGGPWLLSRIIGAAMARELYFFPRKLGAEEALKLDLVTRVFEPDAFEAEVAAMARKLGESAPLALAAMKSNFVEAERTDLATFIALETARHGQLFHTEDRKEAFQAYLEKRRPNFQGR